MTMPYKLLLVVGARPNFMKMAPIVDELRRHPGAVTWRLVHTGQHYDAAMSGVFFGQLGMPRPDVDLGVGSGSHAQQTAATMAAFESVVLESPPDLVVVVGDVNSTLACALVSAKLGIRVAHVEAGLRSFDRTMPEEVNRILTDHLSDLLFVTEASGVDNLRREGIADEKIHLVGNVMIDTLLRHRAAAERLATPRRFGVADGEYALLTLHRPSNVDDPVVFERLLQALAGIGKDVPILFPIHPRTRPALSRSPQGDELIRRNVLRPIDPLGYLEFLGLMAGSRAVLTDSGGIQEETTVLGVPCLTLRDNTERPVTITCGTNRLVGTQPSSILEGWAAVRHPHAPAAVPPLWDGHAARRIVDIVYAEVTRPFARTCSAAT